MTNAMTKQVADFFERIGHLLERGVPLIKALDTLSSEAEKTEKEMLEAVIGLIRCGDTFSQSLERMKFLPDHVLEAIRQGEDQGCLDSVLKDLAGKIDAGAWEVSNPRGVNLLLEAITTQYHDVLKSVNRLLISAAEAKVSDLHLEPTDDGGRVRFRIDGVLTERPERYGQAEYRAIIGRIKEMAALDPGEHRLPQDGRILIRKADQTGENRNGTDRLDLRVSVCPFIHGEKVVVRYLDRNAFPQRFEHIRVSIDKIETIKRWLSRPFGMILVSGPTGSGKTTTLYLLLNELSERTGLNVISIEDPVEYVLPKVYQMQINPSIGLTFPAAIRSILRQDPDVVSTGEIRNPETATLLVQLAQTGHMTLSQLHSRDAVSTLRLIHDLGVPVHVLREITIGVISQRLVRRLCESCKVTVPDQDREMMPEILKQFEGPIYRSAGCDACHHTGFRGRDVIMELLEPDSSVWALLKQISSPAESRDTGQKKMHSRRGFRTLLDDGYARIMEGVTSWEEIQRVALND